MSSAARNRAAPLATNPAVLASLADNVRVAAVQRLLAAMNNSTRDALLASLGVRTTVAPPPPPAPSDKHLHDDPLAPGAAGMSGKAPRVLLLPPPRRRAFRKALGSALLTPRLPLRIPSAAASYNPPPPPPVRGGPPPPLTAAIAILSAVAGTNAPRYRRRRDVIRNSWLHFRSDLETCYDPTVCPGRLVVHFVVRCGGLDAQSRAALRAENASNGGDMLCAGNVSAYDGGRLRGTVLALHWWLQHARRTYPDAKFVGKADDDVYVHLPDVAAQLSAIPPHASRYALYGRTMYACLYMPPAGLLTQCPLRALATHTASGHSLLTVCGRAMMTVCFPICARQVRWSRRVPPARLLEHGASRAPQECQ